MTARSVIRGQEGYTLALLLSWGEEEEAQAYLDSLNKGCRLFGNPEWEMPEPLSDLPDLVTAPAMTECLGDPLLRDGRYE